MPSAEKSMRPTSSRTEDGNLSRSIGHQAPNPSIAWAAVPATVAVAVFAGTETGAAVVGVGLALEECDEHAGNASTATTRAPNRNVRACGLGRCRRRTRPTLTPIRRHASGGGSDVGGRALRFGARPVAPGRAISASDFGVPLAIRLSIDPRRPGT